MEDTPMEKPGYQKEMTPRPEVISKDYKPAGKLEGQVAIISGGDSGIGRSVAVAFAAEGADVAIIYLEENEDARDTRKMVEKWGKKCLLIAGDVGKPEFCEQAVQRTLEEFGKLDIVVNNAAEQTPQEDFMKITPEQLEKTFRTNIFGYFFLTRAAMPHLKEGARIINTTSVTAYRGSPGLVDYSATKGAIVAFTRSLSGMLAEQKIRVNGVAPGPIWTPLIPSTFPEDKVEKFGEDTPLGRPGQPSEVATCFVFLASQDSSYITGQVLHPNGGEIING
ncbi:hypothetical protein DC3_03660 [Deinococcus cellulosilyticus NBRC 106333 = KACC 11606]|uniref:Uncharacterized protein n=2 Tax=Deinococcus cellulosilyticus TaxID=401558 RepID=A0A511MWG2_DEIC1|nr:hypothetical protein DC3_03660 [Deinococcus cellulosilyticus NBRC 106333 = KACC 11606]